MTNWSNPNPLQWQALHEALLFAYPAPADLNTLLVLNLGRTYAELAPAGDNYRNALTAILLQARSAGWLHDLVQAARRDKPQSPKLLLIDRSLELTTVEIPKYLSRNLDAIVREDGGFQDLMPWVEQLAALAQRTCRIECPVNTARGTGWLVGRDLLLTNWHVIADALPSGTRQSSEFVCRFDYATTSTATRPGTGVGFAQDWCLDASPPSAAELGTGQDAPNLDTLDFALIRLATPVGAEISPTGGQRGWVAVKGDEALPRAGEIVFVIQYPQGLPVKLATGDIEANAADGLRIFHSANTAPGSSGAIVVNAKLDPIGLHHAGDALYQCGKSGIPKRNQAIPIGRIVTRLKANGHLT